MHHTSTGSALRRDERGVVLVLGLALGTVLVATIAELVALGGVVRAREAAQAAADASALENAVWHARGMNAVAALNIVMGIAVAVLVLWRLVLAASTLARLAALVALPLGAGAPREIEASPLAPLLEANAGVEERVRAMVAGLAAAQVSVAAYAPLLATRGATELAARAGRRVETFGASAWVQSASAPAPRLASPVSLPLEAEPGALLCAQPVSGWDERVSAVQRSLQRELGRARAGIEPGVSAALGLEERGEPSTIVAHLAGLADAIAPGVFCSLAAPAFDGIADTQRALAAADRRRLVRGAAPAKDVERALAALGHPGAGAPVNAARAWSPARNGNVYLRSAAQLSNGALAHAEMYFDCDASWDRCVSDAAWQPRWRARLRRVRPLSELLRAAGDVPSAWRPGRMLPPAEPALLRDALPVAGRTGGDDALVQSLEGAAFESRFVH